MPQERWLNGILPQPKTYRSKYAFAHRFLRGVVGGPFDQYMAWSVDGFNEIEKKEAYKNSYDKKKSSIDLLTSKYKDIGCLDCLDLFMAVDFLLHMHDDMLVKMDIATMAHGLEGRNPFLDHRLVEWSVSLPGKIKMKGMNTKPILRELAKRYLPTEIVTMPKRGFEIPLIRWLREDLSDMVSDVCLSSNGIVSDLFNRDYTERLLSGKLDLDPDRWSRRVWNLFMLAMWENVCK